MKKQFLLFAAAALILTSCGNENTENQGQTQAQIDSAVNAQVAEREAEMARKNDSTLKAMEAEKAAAEAAAAEEAAKKSSGKKTTKTKKEEPAAPAPPPPPPPPPPTIGNGKPKIGGQSNNGGQADGTIGNGKPKLGK